MLKYSLLSLLMIGFAIGNPTHSIYEGSYGSNPFPAEPLPSQVNEFLSLYPNKPTPIFLPQNSIQDRASNSQQKPFNFDKTPVPVIDPARLGGFANILEAALNKPTVKPGPDTINELFATQLKKYDVKRFLLRKILGPNHESEEADGGFFSNQHLKRHGTAGVAGKLLGELIGIKIRESIDKFGKRFGEIAKDFTARNIVNAGNSFARIIKMSRF